MLLVAARPWFGCAIAVLMIAGCDTAKSDAQVVGATGGSQIRTIVLQLRGEAGPMQVKDPEIGLIHNIGGVGLYGNVTILGR